MRITVLDAGYVDLEPSIYLKEIGPDVTCIDSNHEKTKIMDLANLQYVEQVNTTIPLTAKQDTIVVTRSNVPFRTNNRLQRIFDHNILYHINIEVVSNPEFLREGSAISDAYYRNQIVIGANSNRPFGIPIYKTEVRSVEMIKEEFCLIVGKDIKSNLPALFEVGEGK